MLEVKFCLIRCIIVLVSLFHLLYRFSSYSVENISRKLLDLGVWKLRFEGKFYFIEMHHYLLTLYHPTLKYVWHLSDCLATKFKQVQKLYFLNIKNFCSLKIEEENSLKKIANKKYFITMNIWIPDFEYFWSLRHILIFLLIPVIWRKLM